MSVLSRTYLYDEKAAFEHVEAILWADGRVCPHCGNMDGHYKLEGVRSKASKKNPEGVERHGLYKCSECRKQFTVRIGTIFEESHIPLHKWLQAVHLVCSSKKGISSNQLHRTLEITLKSAWFLSHRIRAAMSSADESPLGGGGKAVEADETFIGRVAGVPKSKGYAHKNVVLTLIERGGEARSFHIASANMTNILPIVYRNTARDAVLMSDEARHYKGMAHYFAEHHAVKHSADEYVRGEAHTNTAEGFFSVFKRGMRGIYQHCAEHHLHRYLAEFDFRYNNRLKLGIDDAARATNALIGVKGKRMTYRRASVRTA